MRKPPHTAEIDKVWNAILQYDYGRDEAIEYDDERDEEFDNVEDIENYDEWNEAIEYYLEDEIYENVANSELWSMTRALIEETLQEVQAWYWEEAQDAWYGKQDM